MRFADYFARSFSAISASQFPWTKMFKEGPVSKIIDVRIVSFRDAPTPPIFGVDIISTI